MQCHKSTRACFSVKNMPGVCLAIESDWNKVKQSCSQAEVKRWLWCMTWQYPTPPTPNSIPQIYCFKSTASPRDSIMHSILLGWLFPGAKYSTIWEPCVTHLFWFGENNCVSSLKSVACRLHISPRRLWAQMWRIAAAHPAVCVCVLWELKRT